MADTPAAKPTEPAKVVNTTKAQAQAYLKEVEAYYLQFSGKRLYNPHFYLVKNVNPLKEKFLTSTDTQEDWNTTMTLVKDCKPDPNLVRLQGEEEKQAEFLKKEALNPKLPERPTPVS